MQITITGICGLLQEFYENLLQHWQTLTVLGIFFEDSFFISCHNCKKHFKDTLKCDYSKRKKSSVSRYHIKFDFLFEGQKATSSNSINMCYSPAGWYVLEETVPEVFNTSRGRRQRAVLRTEGTVFPNIDRPRRVKNIFFSKCMPKQLEWFRAIIPWQYGNILHKLGAVYKENRGF